MWHKSRSALLALALVIPTIAVHPDPPSTDAPPRPLGEPAGTPAVDVPLFYDGSVEVLPENPRQFIDVDQDGDLDALVDWAVMFNVDGTFDHIVAHGLGLYDVGLADIDGDGYVDAYETRDGSFEVAWNDGLGGFTTPEVFADFPDSARQLIELDGDPEIEVLVESDGGLAVYHYDGVEFVWHGVEVDYDSFGLAFGDLDRDGRVDLYAIVDQYTLQVFLQQPDGSFVMHDRYLGTSDRLSGGRLIDIDYDGDDELVFFQTDDGGSNRVDDGVHYWEVGPELPWATDDAVEILFDHEVPWNETFAMGDVDGNGLLDVVSRQWVFRGTTDGGFRSMPGPGAASSSSVWLVDWNRDGLLDYLTRTGISYALGRDDLLANPARLTGTVTNEDDQPLHNVCVEALSWYQETELLVVASATTDETGTFDMPVPPGWYHVLAWDCDWLIVEEDPRWAYEFEFSPDGDLPLEPAVLRATETFDSPIELRPGGGAVGLVWDNQLDAGIEGMTVIVPIDRVQGSSGRDWWDLFGARTNEDGLWAVWGLRPGVGIYGARYEHPIGFYETEWWHDQPEHTAGRFHVNSNQWNATIVEEMGPVFFDIYDSSFIAEIIWAADTGVTTGCTDERHFCPEDPVTRAQMATFLSRALDYSASWVQYFADVGGGVHFPWVNALREAGVTLGCDVDGTHYCPNDPVTRAQMASFLVRALDLTPTETDYFGDDDNSKHEANINALRAAAITFGCGGGNYCPNDFVTREQMAAFLYRALGD